MDTEKWKECVRAPGYRVSNLGRLRGKKGVTLDASTRSAGYAVVCLSIKSKRQMARVHVLVAEAFLPNPDNKPCVNHINGIRDDNRAVNLEWATIKENNERRVFRNATPQCNGRQKRVVQTSPTGELVRTWDSIADAARHHGIAAANISSCCRGLQKTAVGHQWAYEAPTSPDEDKAEAEVNEANGVCEANEANGACEACEANEANEANEAEANEKWQPLTYKGYPYVVSSMGRVKLKSGIISVGSLSNGYRVCNGGHRVHRLVALAHLPNSENRACVNHKDGNRQNNKVENLEWATHKENSRHAADTGLRGPQQRYQRPVRQLSAEGVEIAVHPSITEASRATKCNAGNIGSACRGERYLTVGGFRWEYVKQEDPAAPENGVTAVNGAISGTCEGPEVYTAPSRATNDDLTPERSPAPEGVPLPPHIPDDDSLWAELGLDSLIPDNDSQWEETGLGLDIPDGGPLRAELGTDRSVPDDDPLWGELGL